MTPKLNLKQLFHLPTNLWGKNLGQAQQERLVSTPHFLGSQLGNLKGWRQPDRWGWNHMEASLLKNLTTQAVYSLGPSRGCQLEYL